MRQYRSALIALALVGMADVAHGQGMIDRMKKHVEDDARRKVEERAVGKTDKATDEKAASSKGAATSSSTSNAPASTMRAGEGAWANYDFVPGNRLLFATDFTKDKVGDFPQRLEFIDGVVEVVQWQGASYLRVSKTGRFYAPLAETLPDRFTIEWDYLADAGECWVYPRKEGTGAYYSSGFDGRGGVARPEGNSMSEGDQEAAGKLHHARVMVDKRYTKMYIDDKRVANVPNVDIERENAVHFYCDGTESSPMLIGNIRIAAGGKPLYDAISSEGRVATQGILFDTGSDVIRPESTPTLTEIAAMLREHPDLKLAIEGHTDNVGAEAANLALSQKRAAAVKATLVSQFSVSADRLTTTGLGASKPTAPNATAEGRQTNRRVELVKQ